MREREREREGERAGEYKEVSITNMREECRGTEPERERERFWENIKEEKKKMNLWLLLLNILI